MNGKFLGIFKKLQNTIRLAIILPNLLDNLLSIYLKQS